MSSAYRRLLLWLGDKRAVIAVASRLQPRVDRVLMRIGRGRISTGGPIPALLLTTTGRRSGASRIVPLYHFASGTGWAVVDTSYGRPDRPSWSLNLAQDPECSVRLDGAEHPCVARRCEGDERHRLWEGLVEVWPHYARYAEESGRTPWIWLLEQR